MLERDTSYDECPPVGDSIPRAGLGVHDVRPGESRYV